MHEGQTINLAIGQGALQVSPLQLAVAYSALINGGTVVRPHVAEAVIRDGVRHSAALQAGAEAAALALDVGDQAGAVRGREQSVRHVGLGLRAASRSTVAGKTGTAQAPPRDDHSWYASWAPYDHPKLVVVVMIEHGGFGAEAAAPAAKQIYEAYFHTKSSLKAIEPRPRGTTFRA